jgi:hypothetical protein
MSQIVFFATKAQRRKEEKLRGGTTLRLGVFVATI